MIDDIERTLWATADKLRASMDAAEYKHLALGLMFLKYIALAVILMKAPQPADLAAIEGTSSV